MTPKQEMIYGELWATMAAKEGHKPRLPKVTPPEIKSLNQQRNRAPLTQKVIDLLKRKGPMRSGPAGKILGIPPDSVRSTFNRLAKNGQIRRYKTDAKNGYMYYVDGGQ